MLLLIVILLLTISMKLKNKKWEIHLAEGITLEQVLNSLLEHYGWVELGKRIDIRCFNSDPSVKSSLKFLRKTPWARKKVEALYIVSQKI